MADIADLDADRAIIKVDEPELIRLLHILHRKDPEF